jgi:hypothetical protein
MLRRKGLAGVFGVLLAIFFASAAAAHTGSGLAGVTWDTVHSFVGPALIAASEEGDQNEQGDQNDPGVPSRVTRAIRTTSATRPSPETRGPEVRTRATKARTSRVTEAPAASPAATRAT